MTSPLIYDGTARAPSMPLTLHAGRLSMRYENGALRYLRFGDTELIRMIYAAVRDQNWQTIPGEITLREQLVEADSFRIVFEMHHSRPPVQFSWVGTIIGSNDGSIMFNFDGTANAAFQRNRIGFCVLHPMDAAGKPCSVEHVDGSVSETVFPEDIAPHQPIFDIRALTYEAESGVQARVVMLGDTFEMEDQRNWSDASYKTYCTPLSQPYPVTVQQGERIRQTIRVQLLTEQTRPAPTGEPSTHITITDDARPLPDIGLGMASHSEPLSANQIERLNTLSLAHLRADLRLYEPDAEAQFARAADAASALGVALELAIFVSDSPDDELNTLVNWLEARPVSLARFAVFHAQQPSTPVALLKLAKEKLARFNVPVGGGTDAYFTQLNRQRPPVDALDFVTYSINPQVHAFDNASLVETLAAQAATINTARTFSGDKPIHVGPVTFKIRWNPDAAVPIDTPPDVLPPQVDVRQNSLFGAGWTLGSLKYLAEGGANAVTYFETTGWRGIMAAENGSPLPDQFHDIAGSVYPMWHIFERLGAFAGGTMLVSQSSSPLTVESLALRSREGSMCVLVANFTPQLQAVTVSGLPDNAFTLRLLDEHTADDAIRNPMQFRDQAGTALSVQDGEAALTLPPYAVAFIQSAGANHE